MAAKELLLEKSAMSDDTHDEFMDHARFEGFQYIGYAQLETRALESLRDLAASAHLEAERQQNGGREKTSITYESISETGPEVPSPSSSSSVSRLVTLRLTSKSIRLLDVARGCEIVPQGQEDEALLCSLRRVISQYWVYTAKVKYKMLECKEAGEEGEGEGEGQKEEEEEKKKKKKSEQQVAAVVRIDVYVSNVLWNDMNHLVFEKTHVKRVFGRLKLHAAKDPTDLRSEVLRNLREERGSILSKVFDTLPKHKDLVSRNFYMGQFSSVEPIDRHLPGMWLLPGSALQRIVQYLDNSSLGNLAATCKHLHSLCCIQVPGLRLELYPHQKIALFWMLSREGNPKHLSLCPSAKEFKTGDDFSFWVDSVSSKVSFEAPRTFADCRGGFLCDEPGMGKTVTAISLVLRTKSCLPQPPEGCVPIFSCEGSRQGFYEIESQDAGNMTILNNAKVTRNSRSSRRNRRMSQRSTPVMNGSTHLNEAAASTNNPSSAQPTARLGQSGSPSTEATESKQSSSATSWVQCDACKKWRVIKQSMNLDKNAKWFCKMSSDPELQAKGCAVPEEEQKGADSNNSTFKSLGYILVDKKDAKNRSRKVKFEEDNVQFFISVLKNRKDSWKNIASAIHFLSNFDGCQKQLVSVTGLHVPSGRRDPDDYGNIFESLGLVRIPGNPHSWIQPLWIGDQFRFDQTALILAMEELAQFKTQYIQLFLSSATLIVVPTHLVAQWKVQIEKCCDGEDINVFTYDGREKEVPVHELAWNYDIVLTTFQMLTAQWTFCRENSILMQIHWLRILLDEGHSLGSSLSVTNKLQMACRIKAERRWVMTGTPTPETVAQGAAHLLPLLKFLHEPQYGLQPVIWQPCVQKPLEAGKIEGAHALVKSLSRLMIHASKSDLETIPKCNREVQKLNFDPVHAKNYNEFVAIVQKNLLLADWWDDAHHESLMHSSKNKEMMIVLKNIRLSCNLAGHMKLDVYDVDIRETLMIITQMKPNIGYGRLALIERACRHGAHCERCKEFCRVPIITPRCAHILCVDCTGSQAGSCILCNEKYKMERGQYSPQRSVPVELIELQPSYGQADFFAPTWFSASSVKIQHLLYRLQKLRGDKVIVFSQFQEHLRMIEEQLEKSSVPFAGLYSSSLAQNAKKMRSIRAQALHRFQYDQNCQVLLMDGICSHGLDLSFCSHVILMEPIWDSALEEQVVSRAHRMGQRREVLVETFVMSNTIEEQVISVRGLTDNSNTSFDKEIDNIYELRKRRHLLSHLRTVSINNESKNDGELEIMGSPSTKGTARSEPEETHMKSRISDQASGKTIADELINSAERVADLNALVPDQSLQPIKKKVKFAEPDGDQELSEDALLLSSMLAKLEAIKSQVVGFTEQRSAVELAMREQISFQGKEQVGKTYFLLVSSFWTPSKSSADIYLLQKEKHPRYTAPKTFEIAREFPDWFITTLASVL